MDRMEYTIRYSGDQMTNDQLARATRKLVDAFVIAGKVGLEVPLASGYRRMVTDDLEAAITAAGALTRSGFSFTLDQRTVRR